MNTTEIKNRDQANVLGNYDRFDICIEAGSGATCWSPEGKKYVDFTSGIGVNSLGYCDEGWIEAVTRQLCKLQHASNLFYTLPCGELAELLTAKTGMSKVFFCNSGAEANEAAIKAARKYSNLKYGGGRNEIITLVNSFHGRTLATVTATGQEKYHKYFEPFVQGFSYAEANNIEDLSKKVNSQTCAVMMEIVQGEGGVIPLQAEFVKYVAELCEREDILLIIDEVQCGVGRTGKFFAYEHFGINPDMVSFAKGIGGGLPIGGVLFNGKTEGILKPGDHGTTYGGNPIACAGGVEIVKRMTDEFLEEIASKGKYMADSIAKFPKVEAVTGLGMMLGVKLSCSTPKEIAAKCMEQDLLILTAGEKLRILPPLIISKEEMETGLGVLKKVLTDIK